jgi:hypothetical protein
MVDSIVIYPFKCYLSAQSELSLASIDLRWRAQTFIQGHSFPRPAVPSARCLLYPKTLPSAEIQPLPLFMLGIFSTENVQKFVVNNEIAQSQNV